VPRTPSATTQTPAFYCEQNPDFAAREGTALLVWVPLDLANIASALARASLRAVRAIFASREPRPRRALLSPA